MAESDSVTIMPDWTRVPEDHPCDHCQERPAAVMWLGDGDMVSAIHGARWWWCERCAVEAQLERARERAAAIPDLERRLEEEQARAVPWESADEQETASDPVPAREAPADRARVAEARLGMEEASPEGEGMAGAETAERGEESREAWLARKLANATHQRTYNERKLRRQKVELHEANEALRARAVQVRLLVETLESLTRHSMAAPGETRRVGGD